MPDKRPEPAAAADPAALDQLRARVDQIDDKILALLNERAQLSIEIGHAKSSVARAGHAAYDPAREAQVYQRLLERSAGPLPADAVRAIYGQIISSSRSLQAPLKVTFLGPEATFSHQAALAQFGSATALIPVASIPDVFRETEAGRSDYGIVPIENSTEGPVTFTLDTFVDSELKACAEFRLEIHEALMSRCTLAEVTVVYSHPQAIGQCRNWLRTHLPKATLVETASTVAAAAQAAREANAAAIGPELAAAAYGLKVLEPRIQDAAGNVTRFLVIGPRWAQRSGRDRMAMLFSIKDRVGVLRDVLALFASAGINLTKIESRPSKRRAWDYLFFVDLNAHPEDPTVVQALRELQELTVFSKVIGAWPRTD